MPSTVALKAGLSREWSDWILESLLANTPMEQLLNTVVAHTGVTPAEARQYVSEVKKSSIFAGVYSNQQRLAKLESLLDNLEFVRLMASKHGSLARERSIEAHDFFERFYSTNTPLIIDTFAAQWPAVVNWSPRFISDCYGQHSVELMGDRDEDRRYEENFERHRRTTRLSAFIDDISRPQSNNNSYMVANNRLLERPEFAPLLSDIRPDPRIIMPPSDARPGAFLWLGGAGTVTPLHHDIENVLFVQVYGAKHFTLVSPYQSHRVYNDVSVYSEVNPVQPDLLKHPLFKGVSKLEVTVKPGEALFIPVGWWHHVESLEVSISLSFIDFTYPNSFDWRLPQLPHSI